jgi:LysM repeat protein
MPLTQKQINELNSASARLGTAQEGSKDRENIAYAQKIYGYKYTPPAQPSSAPTSQPSISPPAPTNAYTIKSGDTLSAIAKSQGTTIAELMKLNPTITNPNLIYSGKSLNLPGNAGMASNDYSGINNIPDANKAINANQATDAASTSMSGEPETRKTVEDVMSEIKSSITPEKEKPTADFTESYLGYRTQYGVNEMETQLNELRAQEQDLLATKTTRINAERGKTVATNVMEGRVSQVERQENERITAVQNSITNLTNQLNSKYNIIDTLMKTKEMDYNAAVSTYDKEMSNNIAIFNAAKNILEEDKTEEEKAQDNARSNAQIALNAYTARGMTYDELSVSEQTNLTKMGVQSGLGADFFANVMKVSAGKDILTTITSADDTKVSIIYKDGTTKTISTGLPAKKVAGSTLTKSEIKEAEMDSNRQTIMGDVGRITGEDMKVDPDKMKALRQDVVLNNPELLSWFDNAYQPKDMLNSSNYPRAVRVNQWLNK